MKRQKNNSKKEVLIYKTFIKSLGLVVKKEISL